MTNITERRLRQTAIKDATIKRFYDEVDCDSEIDLYDKMMSHLVEGDFNDIVADTFSSLEGLRSDEKEDIINLANKHNGILFYDGDVDNWTDSLESFPITDYDMITFKLLDNYNFLLDVAKKGGESTLSLMEKFVDNDGYNECSVVEYLRNTFPDDKILETILVNMGQEDSFYNFFDDYQKSVLLTYPKGTLYFYGDDSVKLTNPLLLSLEIFNRENGRDLTPNDLDNNISYELARFFREEDSFDTVVSNMSLDYNDAIRATNNIKARDMVEFQRDIDGKTIVPEWTINNNPLMDMFDTPYHPENTSTKNK